MSRENIIELEGEVLEVLSGGKYKLLLEQGSNLVAKISGKMRMNNIKIIPGDRVKVEVSPYDLSQGRIKYRVKLGG